MQSKRQFLGGISPTTFLELYWQKQPLLVRGALPRYTPPLSPEELAGLACEEEVESRVVTFDGDTWHLESGPFRPATFPRRGKQNWTLLVQDLDEHVPEVGVLLDHLDFLPSWRIDDVMASFAVPGGSVGPHYDEYDVFLLQVSGKRRWQISTRYSRDDLRSDSNLKLLATFEPEQEWVVEPGDLLYLPPHVAHFGVAETNCMTYSLGCRAPSHADLVAQMAGMFLSELDEKQRYRDADLEVAETRLGVSPRAAARTRALLEQAWQVSPDLAARCLGSVATMPKLLFRQEAAVMSERDVTRRLASKRGLHRRKGSRWTWHSSKTNYLFVDGREYTAAAGAKTKSLLETLCTEHHFDAAWLAAVRQPDQLLLRKLVSEGHLLPRR